MTCGFHAGTCPAARLLPRKQYVGSQNGSTSGYWLEIMPLKAIAWRTTRTPATMESGPADARVHRLSQDGGGSGRHLLRLGDP